MLNLVFASGKQFQLVEATRSLGKDVCWWSPLHCCPVDSVTV